MLRRKLFMILGPLVTVLLISGVTSIVLLQHVLGDFRQVAEEQSNLQVPQAVPRHTSQAEVVSSFRRIVIGMSVTLLIVINLAVIILLRVGAMVVRPVDKLVEATRALMDGRFDFRIKLDEHDEFDELARACNGLAERLQTDEQRQMQTLGQVALAMNHEINNAISIIELQLRLLERQAPGGPGPQRCLQQIHQSLQRMTNTVQSLKSVRRIVLTDYLPGVKMLDLERSQVSDADERAEPAQPEQAECQENTLTTTTPAR